MTTPWTASQKAQAALEVLSQQRTTSAIAQQYGVDEQVLAGWALQLRSRASMLFHSAAAEGGASTPLASRRLQIGEDERERIARTLHDDLGQTLLALRLDVASLHLLSVRRHQRLHRRAAAALENLDAAMGSLKAIVRGLRPFELELGLLAAVDWQLKEFQRQSRIDCRLSVARAEGAYAVGSIATLTIFRVLQEALSNIGRHAGARLAEVILRHEDGFLCMEIRDDGIGLRRADRHKANVSGLAGMQLRVAALGGELRIESRPGEGTALLMRIPDQALALADAAPQ